MRKREFDEEEVDDDHHGKRSVRRFGLQAFRTFSSRSNTHSQLMFTNSGIINSIAHFCQLQSGAKYHEAIVYRYTMLSKFEEAWHMEQLIFSHYIFERSDSKPKIDLFKSDTF